MRHHLRDGFGLVPLNPHAQFGPEQPQPLFTSSERCP